MSFLINVRAFRVANLKKILVAAFFCALPFSAQAGGIEVLVDEAKIIQLTKPIGQVIIGNPAIADVSVQSRTTLIFTGKSSGHTNVILLDENNRQILNEKVHVTTSNAEGLVVMHRGAKRTSFHCGTICNGRVALGDDSKFTADVLKTTESKIQFSREAATGAR
jgi:hypothetical protein